MKDKTYKYDAFISYRHCDLDKFVAENLHKTLETYDLPKNVKEKLGITGKTIKRVFRDQDELPLSSNLEDPILDALNNSKYLIVICSPRLKDSLWCKKEIETFKKIRGRKNIFCVLIEGEPDDSFPDELLHDNGKLIEPLAADVRGTTKKEVHKKIKEEVLRLVAPMYNLDYDDLKQRHKQREHKRKMIIATSIATFFILFSIYTSIMLLKISSQQKTLKLHQAITLSEESTKALSSDSRYDAVKKSYDALTKYEGVKMPYTSNAEYALSNALGVYDTSNSYIAKTELKTDGVADLVKDSMTSKYALIYDESEKLTLWNTVSYKKIGEYTDVPSFTMDEYKFAFVGDDVFAYITDKGNIKVVSTKDGKLVKEIKKEEDSYLSVRGTITDKYLVYLNKSKLYVYDTKENKELGSYTCKEYFNDPIYFTEDYKYIFTITEENYFDISNSKVTLRVIELATQKEINNTIVNAGYLSGIVAKGDNIFMLVNDSVSADYTLKAISYNYKENKINWAIEQPNVWGKYIYKSYPEGSNHIIIVHTNKIDILDESNGNILRSFDTKSEIIGIYGFLNEEDYLAFTSDGMVNYIDFNNNKNFQYDYMFKFNVEEYAKSAQTEKGFLMIPKNENRVIVYEQNSNKNMKETKDNIKETKSSVIYSSDELKKLKEDYNVQNKSLVSKMLYSTKNEYLFVFYTNNDLAIYDAKTKELLNTIKGIHDIDTYYGKDKYGRMYVGDMTYTYIIDSNFNKVGRVYKLYGVKDDKIYIKSNDKLYSMNIYTLDDLLKEAKEYLN